MAVLDLDAGIAQFENLVKYAAKKVSDSSKLDAAIDVQDLYQEGIVLLLEHLEKYKEKTVEEFKLIFSTSLFRHLYKKARNHNFVTVELDTVYELGYTEDVVNEMYTEYIINQLKDLLSGDKVVLSILQELLQPSEKVIWEMTMDIARKKMLKSQGKKVNLFQNIKVKMIHIKRALGITQKRLDEGLIIIRKTTRQLLEQNLENGGDGMKMLKDQIEESSCFGLAFDSTVKECKICEVKGQCEEKYIQRDSKNKSSKSKEIKSGKEAKSNKAVKSNVEKIVEKEKKISKAQNKKKKSEAEKNNPDFDKFKTMSIEELEKIAKERNAETKRWINQTEERIRRMWLTRAIKDTYL